MTTEHEAARTLVKSPPELWAECSDAESLSRHLSDSFGEIRITRLEPETSVAWEGERASGTVRIEPSAWGTRVTLTALTSAADEPTDVVAPEPEQTVEEEPEEVEDALVAEESVVVEEAGAVEEPGVAEDATPFPEPVSESIRRRGLIARMRAFFKPVRGVEPVVVAEPQQSEVHPSEPEPGEFQPAAVAMETEPAAVAAETEAAAVAVAPETEPAAAPEPLPAAPEPESPPATPELDPTAVLAAALDSLGQAHHRPFSRA